MPSKGKYYKSGLDLSIDGELGVMPMTAVDEIKLKSPDALFNGEAIFELFKSCAPDIKNPEEIPACDVDLIMMAIKVATHGEQLEVSSKCPSCQHQGEFTVNLTNLIASSKPVDDKNVVEINGAKVFVRPFSLKSQIKGNIQKFHQVRMQLLLNQEMNENQKAELFNEALLQASAISVQVLADNILEVKIDAENDETISVTDNAHIFEWVQNMDSKTYEKVISRIKALSDPKINKQVSLTCQECSKEYSTVLELDPVSFFT